MQDLTGKTPGATLTAAEWNQLPEEVQEVIESTGQTLSGSDLQQLQKGIATYVASGSFYTDSGAADAYVLTNISLLQRPISYTTGMLVRFIPLVDNTGASTGNIATLGNKDITYPQGSALIAGALTTANIYTLEYDGTNLVLRDISSLLFAADYATVRAYPSVEIPVGATVRITGGKKQGVFNRIAGTVTDDDGTLLVFDDDSAEHLSREYDRVISVPWFTEADGTGSGDDAGITAAGALIQSNGGGVLDFGGGDNTYLIKTDTGNAIETANTNQYRSTIDFSGIPVEIRAGGAKFIISRNYATGERDIVFRFKECPTVICGSFVCTYTGTRADKATEGGVLFFFRQGNKNIQMSDQNIDDWSLCIFDSPGNNLDEFTNHWSGKRFTIFANDTGYPYLTDNGGTNIDVVVESDGHFRGLTFQDVRNATGVVKSKNFLASNDVGLSGTLQDVTVNYNNLNGTKASADDTLTIQFATETNTDGFLWSNSHDGSDAASVLTDTAQAWTVNALVGYRVFNDSDNSTNIITANTATTITATLANGYANEWNTGDRYHVGGITGSHDGSSGASVLTDTGAAWPASSMIGWTIKNTTDGSFAIVTANTGTTITGTLQGGTDDDWDASDTYVVGPSHAATNVDLTSHVETFNGAFLGKPLGLIVGVGVDEADIDPGYILSTITLSCILKTDNASQESFRIQHPSAWVDGFNISGLKVRDCSFEGGLAPEIDLGMLIDSAVFENIISDNKLRISNATSGNVLMNGGKFPATSDTTGDTSEMTLINCDIADDTTQSLNNKQFLNCFLNGRRFNRDDSAGIATFSAASTVVISDSRVTPDTAAIVIPFDNNAGAIQGSADHIVRKSSVTGTSITIGSASGSSVTGTFRYYLIQT